MRRECLGDPHSRLAVIFRVPIRVWHAPMASSPSEITSMQLPEVSAIATLGWVARGKALALKGGHYVALAWMAKTALPSAQVLSSGRLNLKTGGTADEGLRR